MLKKKLQQKCGWRASLKVNTQAIRIFGTLYSLCKDDSHSTVYVRTFGTLKSKCIWVFDPSDQIIGARVKVTSESFRGHEVATMREGVRGRTVCRAFHSAVGCGGLSVSTTPTQCMHGEGAETAIYICCCW